MSEQKMINIRNKRATFDYEILEEYVAGIVLVGTEIKSIRAGKASLTDSFCYFDKGELWIRGVNIAEYGWGTCNNHAPRRDRKLLLNRRELEKLTTAVQQKGYACVALSIYWKQHLIKCEIGLGKGKKEYDKRHTEKERDSDRELHRAVRTKGKED